MYSTYSWKLIICSKFHLSLTTKKDDFSYKEHYYILSIHVRREIYTQIMLMVAILDLGKLKFCQWSLSGNQTKFVLQIHVTSKA